MRRLSFYERQGVTLFPGCRSFYFGNTWDMIEYQKAYEGDEPIAGP